MLTTFPSARHGTNAFERVVILIAQGFEEISVIQCLGQMREAGLMVVLVSATAGLISSAHGLAVRPDRAMDQVPPDPAARLIVVPGSRSCAEALMADPRVHQLIKSALWSGVCIAAMRPAQPVVAALVAPIRSSGQFVAQDGLELPEFVKRLVHLASV